MHNFHHTLAINIHFINQKLICLQAESHVLQDSDTSGQIMPGEELSLLGDIDSNVPFGGRLG